MPQSIVQVDAFADKPFAGNPAAVCILDGPRDERWMQNVALEMNLSETAFLFPEGTGYRLRWFTPAVEVNLCGHATLASAHVLFSDGHVPEDTTIRFQTRSGELTASYGDGMIWLDFPAYTTNEIAEPHDIVDAVGGNAIFFGKCDNDNFVVELESEKLVRTVTPDFAAMKKYAKHGVAVTAKSSDPKFDFVSRYFAPAFGIDEDPVTGSAHSTLGPYWEKKLGKSSLMAYQASKRGGVLQVVVKGNRVALGGKAVTVMRGELLD